MRAPRPKADDIDILSLLSALRRNLLRLILFTLAVAAATYGLLSMMAPRYVSETQISITPKSTNPFPDAKREAGGGGDTIAPRVDKEAINTHVRALGATDLVLAVANKLQLATRPEFNPAAGDVDLMGRLLRTVGLGGVRPGQTAEDRMLETVFKQLEISAVRETRYINLRFSSVNPQLAADFANELAESYRAKLVTVPVKETEDAVAALQPKVEQLRREVLDAESAAESFRAESDQFKGGAQGTPVNDQRMAALNDELTRAEAGRAEVESRWRTARDLVQLDSADVLPEVQRSQLIQSLITQRVRLERQISEAQASLLPAHPRMRQLTADLAGLKTTLKGEIGKIVQSMEKDARTAALRSEQIVAQIDELKAKVAGTSGAEAKLRALESTAKSKRAELEALQKQLENNRTLQATRAVPIEAQIVSAARATSVPIWPKKGAWTALATIAALLLGAVSIVTSAIIGGARPATSPQAGGTGGTPRRSAAGGERGLGGVVPALAGPAAVSAASIAPAKAGAAGAAPVMQPADVAAAHPTASGEAKPDRIEAGASRRDVDAAAPLPMATDGLPHPLDEQEGGATDPIEPLHEIAYRLVDRGGNEPGYRSLITGEDASIDCAPEAAEIVTVLASIGRLVVLVDWNLDGAGISAQLGLNDRAGLTDLIAGRVQLADVVTRLPGTDVHFIPCGQALASSEATIDADHVSGALDSLDEHYHQIVVCGGHDDAHDLFQALQGRFDCGITVAARPDPSIRSQVFLGFEVADIDLLRHDRLPALDASPPSRLSGSRPARASATSDETANA